ncbi:MAG: ribosome maturation factor RimM [Treponema sp.]|jgi:16S rRNA processing protein RimM|nr:ribosome maturation factor RimM [Treponema sp.]
MVIEGMNKVTEQFIVGVIGPPFGIKGHVKVRSCSGEYEHLKQLDTLMLRCGPLERILELEETLPLTRGVGMKFKGIDTPEQAQNLRGGELITDRSHAAPLKPDEFYVEDLRGLEVVGNGAVVGHIRDVLEGGGGNLVEIRLISGALKLVPFRKEFFGDICLETGTAVLLEQWILA